MYLRNSTMATNSFVRRWVRNYLECIVTKQYNMILFSVFTSIIIPQGQDCFTLTLRARVFASTGFHIDQNSLQNKTKQKKNHSRYFLAHLLIYISILDIGTLVCATSFSNKSVDRLFLEITSLNRGPVSSVGIASDYGLDGPGSNARPDRPRGPPSLL